MSDNDNSIESGAENVENPQAGIAQAGVSVNPGSLLISIDKAGDAYHVRKNTADTGAVSTAHSIDQARQLAVAAVEEYFAAEANAEAAASSTEAAA